MNNSTRTLALSGLVASSSLVGGSASAVSENLQEYKAEYAQLVTEQQDCTRIMTEFGPKQADAAMKGYLLPEPDCLQMVQEHSGRMIFLYERIYRLETGDFHTPSQTLVPNPYQPSSPASGDPGPAENFDIQGIRGNSIYTDENGETHELPTRNYYFRDRASGAIVGSDSPDVPDYSHDYERLR